MVAMVRLAAGLGALLAAAAAAPAQVEPSVLLLARVKARMVENLRRLPNYTCTETIERSVRRARGRRFEMLDTMRLEVALVNGKELFAWPGAGRFEEREIREFAPPGGAIGNGIFALHARAVFEGQGPVFRFAGRETADGRAVLRFDYSVAQMFSGYELRSGPNSAVVGYRGSFWAEESTLDVTRLEVRAVDIPPVLGLREAVVVMHYSREKIGGSEFLLPTASEMTLRDDFGNQNRNRTHLTGCRQFSGESVISFEEPAPGPAPTAPPRPERGIELPADLALTVELTSVIDSGRTAVGDPLTAVLVRDARWKGRVVVPRGAVLSGRLVRLERREDNRWILARAPVPYYIVGVEFDTLELDSARTAFCGALEEIGPLAVPGFRASGVQPEVVPPPRDPAAPDPDRRPGVGLFLVKGDTIRLGRGFRMTWKTIPPQQR
jgi:hypothetical protein